MKKFYVLLTVAMVSLSASAQLKFGVKGGVNVTQLNLKFSDPTAMYTKSNNQGFFIGPMVKFNVPVIGLGLDAAVLYSQSQFKTSPDNASVKMWGQTITVENNTVKQQYVSIPVNVRYSFGLGDMASLFIFAGPQFNFNVGDKTLTFIRDVAEWKNNASQISVNVGLGATVIKHLQVSVNYNIACGRNTVLETTKKLDYPLTGESLNAGYQAATAKCNLWQVSLGWWF